MIKAAELAELDSFDKRRSEANSRGKLRGIGLSNTIERAAGIGFEAAEIRFDKSGTATLFAGSIISGRLGGLYERLSSVQFWLLHAAIVAAGGILILLLAPRLRRALIPSPPQFERVAPATTADT